METCTLRSVEAGWYPFGSRSRLAIQFLWSTVQVRVGPPNKKAAHCAAFVCLAASLRKQLPNILERLELQRIAARVKQKQRRLLPHLPLEANVRLQHELRLPRL